MYKREQYLNKLISYKDLPLIKVITGVRRSGKSTILLQFREYLKSVNIDEDNIIYMNFESSEWFDITNYRDLTDYIKAKVNKKKLYILLDEVQKVSEWEKCVTALNVDIDCDIYVTGSNAYMLSSELTTLLGGRVLTLHVFPFSFKEYNEIKKEHSIPDNFKNYLTYGGMPLTVDLPNNIIKNYLMDIKDVIIKNDVIARNQIKDVALLDNLLAYISSTIGNLTSSSNISDNIERYGSESNHVTIDNYLKMLEDAYIVYRIPRYLLDGKELLKTNGKYYFSDLGIRNVINNYQNIDSGQALENVVCIELLRRDYHVTVGKYKDLEVDFVAEKDNDILYIQVCKDINNSKVMERELKSLKAINDNHPKFILTLSEVINNNIDGIKIINLIDWLLQ